MAAVNLRDRDAATYVKIESSYGATPSTTRCFPIAGSVEITCAQSELEVEDESSLLYDAKDPVLGLQSEGTSAKLGYYLRPHGTQLTSAATVARDVLGELLKAALGGQSPADAATIGTTVASAASATSITVTDAAGFALGQWILVGVGGTLEATRVVQITTSTTLGLNPALSGTPANGQLVVGMYNYYPDPANTASMTLQHALAGNSSHQWTLNGCACDVQFKTERNALLRADFELKAAKFTGPSDQSLSTAAASDTMGSPFTMRGATMLLQAAATTTRTHYPLHSFALKLNGGMTHIPELGGTTEGTVGVMRTGQRIFAEATVRFPSDLARDTTDWTNRTRLQCVILASQGSGTTKRFCVFDMGGCIVVGKPKTVYDGGRVLTEITLRSKLSTLCTGTATDLTRAPFVLAIG